MILLPVAVILKNRKIPQKRLNLKLLQISLKRKNMEANKNMMD